METGLAENILAQQPGVAPLAQHVFQEGAQIVVLAPQVEDAGGGADGVAADGHPFEEQVGPFGEQDALLEGAGFPFVGVAEEVFVRTLGTAGELPFQAGGETGAAASAQPGGFHFGDNLLGAFLQGLGQAGFGGHVAEKDFAGLFDVVPNHGLDQGVGVVAVPQTVSGGELAGIGIGLQGADHFPGFIGAEAGHHHVVDHGGGGLIAQADAGRPFQGEPAVGAGFAETDAKLGGEGLGHLLDTLHLVDHVVAEADHHVPLGFLGKEGVEGDHPFDLDAMGPGLAGDHVHGLAADPSEFLLHRSDDVHHPGTVVTVICTNLFDCLFEVLAHKTPLIPEFASLS